MNAKYLAIHFQGKTHVLNKIPTNTLNLLNQIELAFMDDIPTSWTLQYQDTDGDCVTLTTDNDFEIFLKECPRFAHHIHLEIIPTEKEISFVDEEPDFTDEKLEESENELADSFNVVEDDNQSNQNKEDVMEMDFSDIVSPEEVMDKETSVAKAEVSGLDKKSTSDVEILNSPNFDIENKKIIELDSPEFIINRPYEPEGRQFISPLKLVERSSQTMSFPAPGKGLATQDKIIQTQTRTINLDKGSQFSPFVEKQELLEHPHVSRLPSLTDEGDMTSRSRGKRVVRTVHTQCYCDGCGMCPIIGVRYRCSVCEDFDFCERCEATKEHPHLFLRIKNPRELSKLKHNTKSKSILGDYGEEFSFKDLGKKFKETTLARVMSNTYGQLPEQAMHTLNKLFKNIKSNIARVYEDSSSEEEEEDDDSSNDESHSDVLPEKGSSFKYLEKRK